MEPIPYFFETINRHAILVRPQKPFFDWLNAADPEDDHVYEAEKEDNNLYLIREMSDNDKIKAWLRRNFDQIFQNELNDWYTEEANWPQKRTYAMFCQWFEVEIHSMVLDLEDGPIHKD